MGKKPAPPASAAPTGTTSEREVFARNLRRARLARGLSQRELHRRTGLTQCYISEIERCLRNPTLEIMAALAHAVGKPLHTLLKP